MYINKIEFGDSSHGRGKGREGSVTLWVVPLAQFNVMFLLLHLNVLWELVCYVFVFPIPELPDGLILIRERLQIEKG